MKVCCFFTGGFELTLRRCRLPGAVLPLIRVLRECPGRGQEGAARALEKLASHKDAANTIIAEGELSAFLSALDSGNEQTQLHGVRTLFLLRGVDAVVHSQIVATGGWGGWMATG